MQIYTPPFNQIERIKTKKLQKVKLVSILWSWLEIYFTFYRIIIVLAVPGSDDLVYLRQEVVLVFQLLEHLIWIIKHSWHRQIDCTIISISFCIKIDRLSRLFMLMPVFVRHLLPISMTGIYIIQFNHLFPPPLQKIIFFPRRIRSRGPKGRGCGGMGSRGEKIFDFGPL